MKHFYSWYVRDGGKRSYTWVKNTLQSQGDVQKLKKKGTHRRRRERSPLSGMMIHQDGSSHQWVAGKKWDLIVTMDDATNEHYNVFFFQEEGTASSFQGVQDVILRKGYSAPFIRIEAVIIGTHRKKGARKERKPGNSRFPTA